MGGRKGTNILLHTETRTDAKFVSNVRHVAPQLQILPVPDDLPPPVQFDFNDNMSGRDGGFGGGFDGPSGFSRNSGYGQSRSRSYFGDQPDGFSHSQRQFGGRGRGGFGGRGGGRFGRRPAATGSEFDPNEW